MIERHGRSKILHDVVAHGDTLHLAGIVAKDLSPSVQSQTKQVLTAIEALLIAHGSGREDVVSATIYMTDLGCKPEMNEAWIPFFGDHLPARATIGVADLGPGVLIEIVVVAARNAAALTPAAPMQAA